MNRDAARIDAAPGSLTIGPYSERPAMFAARQTSEAAAKLAAIDRVQGVIEFDLTGKILEVNANFLSVVGYAKPDVLGAHHEMFVDPAYRNSSEYKQFWGRLRAGEFQAGQFRRVGKDGREVWIEASYNPLIGRDGKPYKVVKFATDITRQKGEDADRAGQIAAIGASQGVISFDLEGRILEANPNFLSVVGYALSEIQGRHHSMFVSPEERDGAPYRAFWAALKQGTYQAAQYKRVGKGGREVWIQASYNPIFDAMGRSYKVVKFATDITAQVKLLDSLRELIDRNFGEIDQAVGRSSQASSAADRAAHETTASVQTMAAASEELSASVGEVSKSMSRSKEATDTAFGLVQDADAQTKRLADAAEAMNGIVGLIRTIAAQINLLALNATIEAARAGASGRGFAVVAQEVKALADQAARATDQIGSEIGNVQAVSQGVVGVLASIQASVSTMRQHVVATSTAVEEQGTVTQDISRIMQDTAAAISGITANIGAISASVTDVSVAVGSTREAARVLSR